MALCSKYIGYFDFSPQRKGPEISGVLVSCLALVGAERIYRGQCPVEGFQANEAMPWREFGPRFLSLLSSSASPGQMSNFLFLCWDVIGLLALKL